jgi:hypothetical protein
MEQDKKSLVAESGTSQINLLLFYHLPRNAHMPSKNIYRLFPDTKGELPQIHPDIGFMQSFP